MIGCACVSCGFRLRNARNASDCVWMETGLDRWITIEALVGGRCWQSDVHVLYINHANALFDWSVPLPLLHICRWLFYGHSFCKKKIKKCLSRAVYQQAVFFFRHVDILEYIQTTNDKVARVARLHTFTWTLCKLFTYMPCRSHWSIGYRHPALSCAAASIFLQQSSSVKPAVAIVSPDLFSTCSLVALYLCGLAMFTVVLVWQCRHFFSVCVKTSSIFFF